MSDKQKQEVLQRRMPKVKIVVKDNIAIHDKYAPAYLTFEQPGCSTPHVPMDWIESFTEREVVLKDNFLATVTLGEFPVLHLTEYLSTPPESEWDLNIKAHGPCLPMSYIEKIIDLNTGKQIWPEQKQVEPQPKIRIVLKEGFAVKQELWTSVTKTIIIRGIHPRRSTALMHTYCFEAWDEHSLTLKTEYVKIVPEKYCIRFTVLESCKENELLEPISIYDGAVSHVEFIS